MLRLSTYDELLSTYESVVKVKEADFSKKDFLNGYKGLYKNGKIVIDRRILTLKEKACILAEELGHHFTSSGNLLDSEDIRNIKQEKRARNWGYERLVGIIDIINAYEAGVQNRCDLSEYLEVTEEYIELSIQHYREKYGLFLEIDNYIVFFEPHFGIMKRL